MANDLNKNQQNYSPISHNLVIRGIIHEEAAVCISIYDDKTKKNAQS